jgi:hypothetical protein
MQFFSDIQLYLKIFFEPGKIPGFFRIKIIQKQQQHL